jgi:hypothetical protein
MRSIEVVKMIALASLVFAGAGCGKRHTMKPAVVFPPQCELLRSPLQFPDTITVALFDTVDPARAPRARSADDRLVFNGLYQPLIAVDCLGETRGALAQSWKKGAGGRRWTFELRPDARFWNGEPVTAWDVEWWWLSVMRGSPLIDSVIDSIAVVDERVVDVYFRQSYRYVPPVLSSTEFAVAAPSYDSEWPLGSGPFQPEEKRAVSSRPALFVRPAFGETGPVVRFVEASVRDARDLLDGRVDVMITADHAVIEYARSRPHLSTAALPWDRTYVLLSTSRTVVLQSGETPGDISQELCDGLAEDAVRNDARGHVPPFWWQALDDCANLAVPYTSMVELPMGASSATMRRILFDRDDPAARDIAERIVALAAARSGSSARELEAAIPGLIGGAAEIVAEGVSEESLALSLRAGGDFAYVFAVPARPVDPCAEARGLFRTIPWLTSLGSAFTDALIPLVETRRHAIANTEHIGVMVDWFGNVFLFNGVEAGDESS